MGIPDGSHFRVSIPFHSSYTAESMVPSPSVQCFADESEDPLPDHGYQHQLRNLLVLFMEKLWPPSIKPDPYLSILTEGFDPLLSFYALEVHQMDIENARRWMVNRSVESKPEPVDPFFLLNYSPLNSLYESDRGQLATALALHQKRFNVSNTCEQILDLGGSLNMTSETASEEIMNRDRNFLLQVMIYLVRRIAVPFGHCVICDETVQVFDAREDVYIKFPAICTKGTCQFHFLSSNSIQRLPTKVCPTSLAQDILHNADIVDLMISMCYTASTSQRANQIFMPFPPDFLVGNQEASGYNSVIDFLNLEEEERDKLRKETKRDYHRLHKVLDSIPSVSEMEEHSNSEEELISFLSDVDPTGSVFSLLRWLLCSNRSVLCKLNAKKRLTKMRTEHQYWMVNDVSPQKIKAFNQKKEEKGGSFFAFHGSSIENWHSILRTGLVNASNTSLMTTGAAFGSGIYCASECSTSFGYAGVGSGKSWKKSRFGEASTLRCLAIVEIAGNQNSMPGPYYVIKKEESLATRFFLFYSDNKFMNLQVGANELGIRSFLKDIAR
eukprot:TRINITY_DN7808_c0_g1_i1.p1 TRINITY_DN7808_c0_g1~~TRINITY_DN7808_c0_g1_i1.p1  ORF type:complete len:648 (-),score=178.91 TRINITY_DN7808_c0_g1_i1:9-1670(-)